LFKRGITPSVPVVFASPHHGGSFDASSNLTLFGGRKNTIGCQIALAELSCSKANSMLLAFFFASQLLLDLFSPSVRTSLPCMRQRTIGFNRVAVNIVQGIWTRVIDAAHLIAAFGFPSQIPFTSIVPPLLPLLKSEVKLNAAPLGIRLGARVTLSVLTFGSHIYAIANPI